uniref:hypothetical protein n=1 Tax=Nocardiopsis halotolerans TaxID=124252 RepID=UPI000380ACB1
MKDFATVWRRSATGELSWLAPDGPVSVPAVPLLDGEEPCVALPLAHLDLVDTLAPRAAFSLTAPSPGSDTGLVGVGPVRVRLDPEGRVFGRELVRQEADKHPPTRLRAGSLMARKENWWWMARALVTLPEVERVYEVRRRDRAEDALLVRELGSDVRVDVVTARDWSAGPGESVELWSRDGGELAEQDEPGGRGGRRALVMGHQASPDFERWERWTRSGTLSGQTLAVAEADGGPDPDPRPYRLLERLR